MQKRTWYLTPLNDSNHPPHSNWSPYEGLAVYARPRIEAAQVVRVEVVNWVGREVPEEETERVPTDRAARAVEAKGRGDSATGPWAVGLATLVVGAPEVEETVVPREAHNETTRMRCNAQSAMSPGKV
ncbi:hypothetical protein AB1Y20_016114 [Prymnesium parvum]|uniref:Uncharacterized protein n=1 Tax=Prymnesium parvum TaxID=97485 RepID=A0AB34K0E2_PRYPA